MTEPRRAPDAQLETLLDTISRLASRVSARPTESQLGAFASYARLVVEWSAKINLVSRSLSVEALIEVLFLDAFVIAREVLVHPRDGGRLVDVGAGAGAPTLPLLVLGCAREATLVEPTQKRVAFLRLAAGELCLAPRVTVVDRRLEEPTTASSRKVTGFSPARGAHDVALSRATFSPEEWLARAEGLAPFVLVFGTNELPSTPRGFLLDRSVSYSVPTSGAARVLGRYRRA